MPACCACCATVFISQRSVSLRGCSITSPPTDFSAIHFDIISETIEPPKPNSRAIINRPVMLLDWIPVRLNTSPNTTITARFVSRKSAIRIIIFFLPQFNKTHYAITHIVWVRLQFSTISPR